MKIKLDKINYNERVLSWHYKKNIDEAVYIHDAEHPDSSEEICAYLQKTYSFICLRNGQAVIPELSGILETHPITGIVFNSTKEPAKAEQTENHLPKTPSRNASSLTPESERKKPPKKSNSAHDKWTHLKTKLSLEKLSPSSKKEAMPDPETQTPSAIEEKTDQIDKTITTECLNAVYEERNACHKLRLNYSDIRIDNLIVLDEDEELWKKTLAMRGDFIEKVAAEKKASNDAFRTLSLIRKQKSIQKTERLYPARAKVIHQIQSILDDLNKVYQEAVDKLPLYHREALYYYFREAVEKAMSVELIIADKTEFELMAYMERNTVFDGNNTFFKKINKKALAIRDKIKTYKFASIILDTWNSEHAITIPGKQDIRAAVQTYLDISTFEEALRSLPEVETQYLYGTKLLLNFKDKFQSVCREYSQFQLMLTELKSMHNPELPLNEILDKMRLKHNPPAKIFAKYVDETMQERFKTADKMINNMLNIQSLNLLKTLLHQETRLKESLKIQLELLNGQVNVVNKIIMEHHHFEQKVSKQIENDSPRIENYYSFKHIIANFFKKVLESYPHQHNLIIAERATQLTIIAISLTRPGATETDEIKKNPKGDMAKVKEWISELLKHSKLGVKSDKAVKYPTLNASADNNFYLSFEWREQTLGYLGSINLDKLKKNPNKSKYLNAFYKEFVCCMATFYIDEMTDLLVPQPSLRAQ